MLNNGSRGPVGVIVNEAHVDTLLPEQFYSPRPPLTPEKMLMLAVLQDAWSCIEKHRDAPSPAGQRLHREAVNWIVASESRWPYSFECLCAALDISAAAVRQRLRVVSPDDPRDPVRAFVSPESRNPAPPLGAQEQRM